MHSLMDNTQNEFVKYSAKTNIDHNYSFFITRIHVCQYNTISREVDFIWYVNSRPQLTNMEYLSQHG